MPAFSHFFKFDDAPGVCHAVMDWLNSLLKCEYPYTGLPPR